MSRRKDATMKTLVLIGTALALMTVPTVPAAAQQPTQAEVDQYVDLVRMDVRQGRADLVGETMQLSAGQAAMFWPIYAEYEAAYTSLGDTELQLIRDYAAVFFTMTDTAADGLVERLFRLNDDEHALIREYHGKISSAVGGAVAARFVQVERRINTLLDLQMAAEIPLLEQPR